MPSDVGDPSVVSRTKPTVEVELTWARPRPAARADLRLSVAWLLFGAFGLATLLAGTTSDPRTGDLIAPGLIVPLYLLTVGALMWAALEIRCSSRRAGPGDRAIRKRGTVR
jgi:hypothetical protein